MERAATTASSLEAEQDSGSSPRCQDTILGDVDAQTRFETTSKQSNDPPLSKVNTFGSGEDINAVRHQLVLPVQVPAAEESDGFVKIIDFLKASSVHYALTVNPIIFTSCIEQFWATAKVKTVNGVRQLQALIDKKMIIMESSIRSDLYLDDAEGTDCLPTIIIFKELAKIGLSAKYTAWNEFSSSMASLLICLATNQKFNLSKYIFDAMVKHLDGGVKFLMYPRFLQVFINQQLGDMSHHKKVLDLQKAKDAQAKEIAALKKRIQRGGSIEDIDADVDVSLVDESQERQNDDLMFDSGVLEDDVMHVEAKVDGKDEQSKKPDDSTASEAVTTASIDDSTTGEAVTTASIDDSAVPTTNEEITLAQTLIQIRS
ncbi:hypothetical protein Tco_0344790 [Tanacetum coccineum]